MIVIMMIVTRMMLVVVVMSRIVVESPNVSTTTIIMIGANTWLDKNVCISPDLLTLLSNFPTFLPQLNALVITRTQCYTSSANN